MGCRVGGNRSRSMRNTTWFFGIFLNHLWWFLVKSQVECPSGIAFGISVVWSCGIGIEVVGVYRSLKSR
jgi:hypothetical protein